VKVHLKWKMAISGMLKGLTVTKVAKNEKLIILVKN
jgi:hypothetical protein